MQVPLVYFLSQFPSFSLNLFAPLLNSAAGGILFGVAFWTMAKTIHKDNVVIKYLIVAAVGFVLLFVAHQAVVLVNAPYSPLGLSSISSFGLASYLIFAGIYSSAISVSQDSELRRSIRNFAIRETRLLDSIGSAHMEQQIQKKVIMSTTQNQSMMVEESGVYSVIWRNLKIH
jgi:hypothetical protein